MPPTGVPQPKKKMTFSELMQQSRSTADRIAKDDLGSLQGLRLNRSVLQTLEEAQELAKRTSRNHGASETPLVQAQILHASHGLDVSQFGRNLETLNLATSIEPIVPLQPTSVEGFLKNERQTALMTTIQKAQKNTMQDFYNRHFDSMIDDWAKEKEEIREILGSGPVLEPLQQEAIGGSHSTNFGTAAEAQGFTSMTSHMMAYARVVWDLAQNLSVEAAFPTVERMKHVAASLDDVRKEEILGTWTILETLVGGETSENAFKKGEYSDPYTRNQLLTTKLVDSSLKALQDRYSDFIDKLLNTASQGGRISLPGSPEMIEEFVKKINTIVPHWQHIGGEDECWAKVYYAMRCGDATAALRFAPDHFANILRGYFDNDFGPGHSLASIGAQYNQAKIENLPFKRAVYNMVGPCEPEDAHREVAINIEDYLWIKLNMVRAEKDKITEELVKLQHLISVTYGEAHFHAEKEPLRYFCTLLLTVQFEKAIEFLRKKDIGLAVHFAIPLHHVGLLNVLPSASGPMLTTIDGSGEDFTDVSGFTSYRFNFGLLIQRYTRSFSRTDPNVALRYYYLLKNFKIQHDGWDGLEPPSLFVHCVTEMVIESREWVKMLGEWDTDGITKTSGYIDAFARDEADKDYIIANVAMEAETRGRILDSIRLHDLANNCGRVLELLNQSISQEVVVQSSSQSLRTELKSLARYVDSSPRYALNSHAATSSNLFASYRMTLPILIKLFQFFDFYFNNQFDEVLQTLMNMKGLNIIPVSLDHVQLCVDNFTNLRQEILQNLPQMLLYSMNALNKRFQQIASAPAPSGGDGGREQELLGLRDRARALVTYAGMIPYRLPGATNAELIRMEVGLML